ncbi:MAG: tyrosine recombinase [Chloroflexi bacterium]|nr:tyrosine recombinase [Chloroflexota bacterium]|tara:strand:+ start:17554 stop:18525 length:972 start_codon:yes stop_codon:yes gene_type:complete
MTETYFSSIKNTFDQYLRFNRNLNQNTIRNYLNDTETFIKYLELAEFTNFKEINRNTIRNYLHWLITEASPKNIKGKKGYAHQSIARKLSSLRALFSFLLKSNFIEEDPSKQIERAKLEKNLPEVLNVEDINSIIESTDSSKSGLRDRVILELLYSCGLRVSELTAINIHDIDFDAKQIRVTGKGSKQRIVLFGTPGYDSLKNYLSSSRPFLQSRKNDPALLLNKYGERISQRSIQKIVKTYAGKANLLSVNPKPHTFRHSYATHLLDGGADIRIVQELLGHSSPVTTQIYTHISQSSAKETYIASHPRSKLKKKPPPINNSK